MKMFLVPVAAILPLLAQAQTQTPSRRQSADSSAKAAPEEGIPVTDPLVIAKCGGCHVKDKQGNLARISWERSTPEGWEEAIKRMVRLNGLKITPADARSIVKYLSTYHGLAPEEAKSVMYLAEHRIIDETNIPNDNVRGACTSCHAFAKPLSWRRSADDWKLLANLHVALYPQADQAFHRGLNSGGGGGRGSRNPSQPLPVDEALTYLAKSAPLHTPEWAAWRARMRTPKLEGRWLVSAHVPGKGEYYGEMEVEPGAAADEFTTRVKLTSVRDGSTIERSGEGLVYAGYAWRGRSKGVAPAGSAPDDLSKEMREAMWISPDQTQADGRWFWGQYQEFGVDVKLERASADPTLISIDRSAVKTGSQSNRVRLFGDNFPASVAPQDLDFGSGVTVRRIVSHSPTEVVAELDVANDAVPGLRDAAFHRSVLQKAIAVYDRVDYIKVVPDSSIARLGSDVHPKGYQQFEAVGYQRGADDKPYTADDVPLGPIDATWSVEEFYSVFGDDDKSFVGTLSPAGLFTPASDAPDPKRQFSRNNNGEVWVVATAKNEKDPKGHPLVGKSYLVVAVPMFLQFDQPEVGK